MNIINWNEDVTPVLDESTREDIFLNLLKGDSIKPWEGLVKRRESRSHSLLAPYVELRKMMGGANVLIRVGYLRYHSARHRQKMQKPRLTITMSMNGTADFKVADFAELNLVVLEAEGAVASLNQDK